MSLTELLGNVGLFGGAVMVVLAALSIYSVALILHKNRRFKLAARQSQLFKTQFAKLLREGQLQDVVEAARKHTDSYVAQVVSAGILEYGVARQTGTDPAKSVELVTSSLDHCRIEMLIDLKRGLGLLATIGSTAPFIGLFGTVVGIINAFQGIAATGSGGMAAVSGGIAEALVATALGIFVAIPAVVAFNQFTGRLERFQVEMSRASTELINFLFNAPSNAPKAVNAR
jgi:biopolymer transport protein ExbB/biopolymer transport protein TolQ